MRRNGLKKKSDRRSPAAKLAFAAVLLVLSAGLIGASVLFRFDEWHALDPDLIINCDKSLKVLAEDGSLLCAAGPVKRLWVSLDGIPEVTRNAFIAVEDSRFYSHGGIDIKRVFGAALADLKAGGFVQGASTISQQLIKLSHLSSEKTVDRKLEEAVLASELERNFTKDEILEMYLNYVYFGGGYYGIEAAARGYFGVHAKELSAAQSATLAGILKSPAKYAPHLDADASLERRNTVLRLMHEQGYLNDSEYQNAVNEECELNPSNVFRGSASVEYAIAEATTITGLTEEELLTGGYILETTVDSELLNEIRDLSSDDSLFPCDNAQIGSAVIRADGSIAALVGGRGIDDGSGLNRACGIERQPGSLIKPILVYAPALESGEFNAASILIDEETDFDGYKPRNSDNKYYGAVTMREAAAKSLNVPAVKLLNAIGVDNAVRFAERLGIDFEGESTGLPLALGGFTKGVSPLEMAGAYAAISNGGVKFDTTSIKRILGPDGKPIYERKLEGERVMREESAFILTSMLKDAAYKGTAKRLKETGLPLAAKTGTTVDETGVRDAWCAAYSPEFTAVVWMGTDSSNEGSLPDKATGGNHPTVFAGRVFSFLYRNRNYPEIDVPEGITEQGTDMSEKENGTVYASNGKENDAEKEFFISGTEPKTTDPKKESAVLPEGFGWSVSAEGCPIVSFIADERYEYRILRCNAIDDEEVFSCGEVSGYIGWKDASAYGTVKYVLEVENPLTGEEIRSKELTVTIGR